MPDDNFPWGMVIGVPFIFFMVGIIIGVVARGGEPVVNPENITIQGETTNCTVSIMAGKADLITKLNASEQQISTLNENLAERETQMKKLVTENEQLTSFVDQYIPSEYFCTTVVPLKYQIPVKQQLEVQKTRIVNATEPIYESFMAEYILEPNGNVDLFDETLEDNHSRYEVISKNTIDLSQITFPEVAEVSFNYDHEYVSQSSPWFFINHCDCERTITIQGLIQIGEKNTTKTETYTEDLYDYKNETTSVCKAIGVTVPLDLDLNERIKLKEEMESKNCYTEIGEAYQNCGKVQQGMATLGFEHLEFDYAIMGSGGGGQVEAIETVDHCEVEGNHIKCYMAFPSDIDYVETRYQDGDFYRELD